MINQDFINADERIGYRFLQKVASKYLQFFEIEDETKSYKIVHAIGMAVGVVTIIISLGVLAYIKANYQL